MLALLRYQHCLLGFFFIDHTLLLITSGHVWHGQVCVGFVQIYSCHLNYTICPELTKKKKKQILCAYIFHIKHTLIVFNILIYILKLLQLFKMKHQWRNWRKWCRLKKHLTFEIKSMLSLIQFAKETLIGYTWMQINNAYLVKCDSNVYTLFIRMFLNLHKKI